MQVLVNCDDHICCDDELIRRVEGVVTGTLERFAEHLLRVEVWLRDLNSEKPGDRDKVCSLEARVAAGAPLSAEHEAPTLAEAIHVAAGKLEKQVRRQLRESVQELEPSGVAGHSQTPR
jgi:ribosome-associated translation inhibitor RaiA